MKRRIIIISLLSLAFLGTIAMRSYSTITPITLCKPIGTATPICGWQNPEDMAILPDGQHVIVSEYGGQNGEMTGTLALLDLETNLRQVLYSGGSGLSRGDWGQQECTETSQQAFSPHGIHLSERTDGRLQLMVVQHRSRESIEIFEVLRAQGSWILSWRGCVIAPEKSMLNDVAGTPEGGFFVTHMMPRQSNMFAMFAEYMKSSLFNLKSGYVLAWSKDEGFRQLMSSEGTVANGIEISSDGNTLFVNYSAGGELRRINVQKDLIEASNSSLPPLDNITWTPDGQLIVAAGLANAFSMMSCTGLQKGNCPGAFALIELDPATLEGQSIYEGGEGTPSGAGTVGLKMPDNTLLIGTFAGDRIVKVKP